MEHDIYEMEAPCIQFKERVGEYVDDMHKGSIVIGFGGIETPGSGREYLQYGPGIANPGIIDDLGKVIVYK